MWSFNHDSGRFEANGLMTVSPDGLTVCTDAGTGIRAPGWHGSSPATRARCGGSAPGGSGGSGGGSGGGGSGGGSGGGEGGEGNEDDKFKDDFPRTNRTEPPNKDFLEDRLENTCDECRLQMMGDENAGGPIAFDRYEITVELPPGSDPNDIFEDMLHGRFNSISNGPGDRVVDGISEFSPREGGGTGNVGDIYEIDMAGPENGDVIISDVGQNTDDAGNPNGRYFTVQTIHSDVHGEHPLHGAREWGYTENPDGSITYYTQATDQATDFFMMEHLGLGRAMSPAQESLWRGLMDSIRWRVFGEGGSVKDWPDPLLERISFDEALCKRRFAKLAQIDNRFHYFVSYMNTFYDPETDEASIFTNILRGTTNFRGEFDISLPFDSAYRVFLYHPATDTYGLIRGFITERRPRVSLRTIFLDNFAGNDADDDGLINLVEHILGTDPAEEDTDNDGEQDGVEVHSGSDPLDGLAIATGITASVNMPGRAVDLTAFDGLVAVANQSAGVTLLNAFEGSPPTIISRIQTPGTAISVSYNGSYLAVACDQAGVAIVDVGDPARPRQLHNVDYPIDVHVVATRWNTVFAGAGNHLLAIDATTGAILDDFDLGVPIHDVVVGRDVLYLLMGNQTLTTVSFDPDNFFTLIDTDPSPGILPSFAKRARLFAGKDTLFATHRKGYNSFDISNPQNPALIAEEETTQFGWKQIVDNGSGRAVAAVSPNSTDDGPHHISVYDATNPALLGVFLAEFETPGLARAVTIYNGMAYVADEVRGLQVINFESVVAGQGAPVVTLNGVNSRGGGLIEGTPIRFDVEVLNQVDVRNALLYINDRVVLTDGNFPFQFQAFAAYLGEAETMTVKAKVFNRQGLATESETLTFDILTSSSVIPEIEAFTPEEASSHDLLSEVVVRFNKSMDPDTFEDTALRLVEAGPDGVFDTGDDQFFLLDTVVYHPASRELRGNHLPGIPGGRYRMEVDDTMRDFHGAGLAQTFTSTFTITTPHLVDFSPEDGSEELFVDQITATFDKPMRPGSLNRNTVFLEHAGDDGSLDTADDIQILNGVFQYHEETFQLTRSFSQNLAGGLYRVTITTQVTDQAGTPLPTQTRWTFTVPFSNIESVSPADGQQLDAVKLLSLRFDVAMNPDTINHNSWLLTEAGPDGLLDTADDRDPDSGVIAEITATHFRMNFDQSLPGGLYRAVATTEMTSQSGAMLEMDFIWLFTVNPIDVEDVFPIPGSLTGALDTVTVYFDKPAEPATVNPATFTLLEAGPDQLLDTADDIAVTNGSITYTDSQLRADLSFEEPLISGRYRATVSGVTDLFGNPMTEDVSFTFVNVGTASIRGQVQRDGVPEEDAIISFVTSKKQSDILTDENGFYEISGIPTLEDPLVRITATKFIDGQLFQGSTLVQNLEPDVLNDADIIVLNQICNLGFETDVFVSGVAVDGPINAMAAFDDGGGEALIAGGSFTDAGATTLNGIALWDGMAYSAMGEGFAGGVVNALAVFDDGGGSRLYAGGEFQNSGATSVSNLARWNGVAWEPVGSGTNGPIHTMAVFDDGSGPALYIGGLFSQAGGMAASNVTRLTALGFEALGSGVNDAVLAFAVYDHGSGANLYLGGSFTETGLGVTANRVVRWDGGDNWTSLGDGMAGPVNALTVFDDGNGPELIVGGEFFPNGMDQANLNSIGRWDGSGWSPLSLGLYLDNPGGSHKRIDGRGGFTEPARVRSMTVFDDGTGPALFVTGSFDRFDFEITDHMVRWKGGAFSSIQRGLNVNNDTVAEPYFGKSLLGMMEDGAPVLFVGGAFLRADFQTSRYMAKIRCFADNP